MHPERKTALSPISYRALWMQEPDLLMVTPREKREMDGTSKVAVQGAVEVIRRSLIKLPRETVCVDAA